MKIYNLSGGQWVGEARSADSFLTRLAGMLFSAPSGKGTQGLWLSPCNAVHTLGMRFPLDILFLDAQGKVLKIALKVRPMCLGLFCKGAHSVLEFFSGSWDPGSVRIADRLELRPV